MSVINKIAVLQKIKENKEVLFGVFSNVITRDRKVQAWKEVHSLAVSLGLVKDKQWQYLRDVLWSNWRKRTVAKKENARQAGAAGGKEVVFNELDNLVLDILDKDSPSTSGICSSDSFRLGRMVKDGDEESCEDENSTDVNSENRSQRGTRRSSKVQDEDDEIKLKKKLKLELKLENLRLMNYKTKLEILELEEKLNLPPSDFTRDLRQPPITVAHEQTVIKIEKLES